MKRSFIFLMLLALLLASCSPSQAALEKALSGTQTAIALLTPTSTNTPEITSTPTETSTPTPTNTPEPTLTPTPDLRVIDGDPIDFLLRPKDLPPESNFYIPHESWMSPHTNQEVINGWGVDEGREYLERTGRVEGYYVYLLRGSKVLTAPEEIYCTAVEYETTEGAQISLNEFNMIAYPERSDYIYTLAKEEFPDLGDTRIAYYRDKTADNGEKYIIYYIEATYYNYLVDCYGYGRKIEVEPEYVANLVTIVLNKLKAAPLISP